MEDAPTGPMVLLLISRVCREHRPLSNLPRARPALSPSWLCERSIAAEQESELLASSS